MSNPKPGASHPTPERDLLLQEVLDGLRSPHPTLPCKLFYDDPYGVTAAFNLNILAHVNRLLAGNLVPGCFRHDAVWFDAGRRYSLHLMRARAGA